jgi:hypothetical protein
MASLLVDPSMTLRVHLKNALNCCVKAAKQQEPWQEPFVSDDVGIDPYPGGEEQRQPLKYTELIELILKAIHGDDLEHRDGFEGGTNEQVPSTCRAGSKSELLFRQMRLETAGNKPKATPPKSLDLDRVEGMDFMVDGFVPANDQTLLFWQSRHWQNNRRL